MPAIRSPHVDREIDGVDIEPSVISGSHQLRIEGVSLSRAAGEGSFLRSQVFEVGGHQWRLFFYPYGKKVYEVLKPRNGAFPIVKAVHHFPGHPALADRGKKAERPGFDTQYAALFVAHVGQTSNPKGVFDTREGQAVWVRDKFELVAPGETGLSNPVHWRSQPLQDRKQTPWQGEVQVPVDCKDRLAVELHGYGHFMYHDMLPYVRNNTIIIQYSMEILLDNRDAPQILPKSRTAGSCALSRNWAALLESGEDADVTFRVGDWTYPAHSLIIDMQCPILAKLAEGAKQAGAGGGKEAKVEGIEPPVFAAVLRYLYTEDMPEVLRCAVEDLLVASHRFQLERLRGLCERRAACALQDDTAIPTLILANEVQADKLLDFCLEYIFEHITRIESTDAYFSMRKSHPSLMDRLTEYMNACKSSQRDELEKR